MPGKSHTHSFGSWGTSGSVAAVSDSSTHSVSKSTPSSKPKSSSSSKPKSKSPRKKAAEKEDSLDSWGDDALPDGSPVSRGSKGRDAWEEGSVSKHRSPKTDQDEGGDGWGEESSASGWSDASKTKGARAAADEVEDTWGDDDHDEEEDPFDSPGLSVGLTKRSASGASWGTGSKTSDNGEWGDDDDDDTTEAPDAPKEAAKEAAEEAETAQEHEAQNEEAAPTDEQSPVQEQEDRSPESGEALEEKEEEEKAKDTIEQASAEAPAGEDGNLSPRYQSAILQEILDKADREEQEAREAAEKKKRCRRCRRCCYAPVTCCKRVCSRPIQCATATLKRVRQFWARVNKICWPICCILKILLFPFLCFCRVMGRCCKKKKTHDVDLDVDLESLNLPGSPRASGSPSGSPRGSAFEPGDRPRRSTLKASSQYRDGKALGGRSPRSPRSPRGSRSPHKSTSSPRGSPASPRGAKRGKGARRRELRASGSPRASTKGATRDSRTSRRASVGNDVPKKKVKGWRKYKPRELLERFKQWKANRADYIEYMHEVVDALDDEEELDFDNLDEYGNPTENVRWFPRSLRHRWKFFLIVYWDPLVEFVERAPPIWNCIRCLLKILPVTFFLASVGWLGYSQYTNMQYEEGKCVVSALPKSFELLDTMESLVRGEYTVIRSFAPTPQQIEGTIEQKCHVTVSCKGVDYGATDARSDDRCVQFRTWSWGNKIECFYHKDDFYGTRGKQLYCLTLPSDLKREMLTCIIAGMVLFLSCFLVGIWTWRTRDMNKQAQLANAEHEREAQELAEAKRIIEARENEEAEKQRAARGTEEEEEAESAGDSEGTQAG